MKTFLLIVLALAIAIAIWSRWVWNTCGYDCGIFGLGQGPASVVGWYFGCITAGLAAAGLVMRYLLQKKN